MPELIQGDANPETDRGGGRAACSRTPARRAAMRAALAEVRGRLGEGGASGRAAPRRSAAMLADGGGGS